MLDFFVRHLSCIFRINNILPSLKSSNKFWRSIIAGIYLQNDIPVGFAWGESKLVLNSEQKLQCLSCRRERNLPQCLWGDLQC
ncbi:hypothetical protein BMAGN_1101 [Bifidobacterium magnum]|uniref:Uncharacterized protein n=1 Tax=Bifidobacterium magnum TaxID=1692 RepID=A0A087BE78_9BIFI|nr:hypothetical protein BMAGN_1101 [Bifidobacterium magnum]